MAPLTGKYCDQWLNTEYNTAVIRAHRAADWKHFETEIDVYPNLRWAQTISAVPDKVHQFFWSQKLTLPVNDPFWQRHHPGERWGCKCTCEQTDEPVNDLGGLAAKYEDTASKGLHGNPAQTGRLFSEDHPYYPKNCGSCPFTKGAKNQMRLFLNKEKDCASCQACTLALQKTKAANEAANEYYTEPKYGERMKICKGADQKELEDNKRALGALLDSFPEMEAVIRKHVFEYGVKNPEYLINGRIADRKGIQSEKGIAAAFNKAIKHGCKAVVMDIDAYMKTFNVNRLSTHIQWRHSDFENKTIELCYVVYRGNAISITEDDLAKSNLRTMLEKLKP